MMVNFFHTKINFLSTSLSLNFTTPVYNCYWSYNFLNFFQTNKLLTPTNEFSPLIILSQLTLCFNVSYNFLVMIYFLVLGFFLITVGLIFLKQILGAKSNLFFLFFFSETEKELNAIDDFKYILSIFFFFFFFNFFFYCYYTIFHKNLIFFSILVIKFTLIFIPLILILEYGFYGIIFVRGSSSSTLVTYEFLLDYINLTAYFLRISIQMIRIIVILVTYFTFNELFLEYYYVFYNKSITTNFLEKSFFLNNGIFFLLHLIFEILHLAFIFLLQTVSFHVTVL